jgi:hypothetical protein
VAVVFFFFFFFFFFLSRPLDSLLLMPTVLADHQQAHASMQCTNNNY